MTRFTTFFDRLYRNDKMRESGHSTRAADTALARKVYRDIYYI